MTDYEKLEEEHRRKKIEYLKNKPAEDRYIMHDIGEGFIVQDKLAHKNYTHENDYMLLTNMFGERREPDGYKTKEEFIEMVNDLDRTVNGHLYKDDAYLILSKQRIYKELESKLDLALSEKRPYEEFEVLYNDYDLDNSMHDVTKIKVEVHREGPKPIQDNSPFLEKLLSNQLFDKIISTINRYQDELETLNKPEDAGKVDALIELKLRIMEEIYKDTELKSTLNFLMG